MTVGIAIGEEGLELEFLTEVGIHFIDLVWVHPLFTLLVQLVKGGIFDRQEYDLVANASMLVGHPR